MPKVRISEQCVFTSADGNRCMQPSAKEALTTLSKNNIDAYILLESISKDDAGKFLSDNKVPYSGLITQADNEDFDASVIPNKGFVIYRGDWTTTLSSLTQMLFGSERQSLSPQQKMDEDFKRYLQWAKPKKSSDSSDTVANSD